MIVFDEDDLSPLWHPDRSRKVTRRYRVSGCLKLVTPAAVGNGDQDDQIDLPLLTDANDGVSPLLPGSGLAGALRAYLARARSAADAEALFGGARGDDDGEQSLLIVDDALGVEGTTASVEVRDGVKLDGKTHTAKDQALYSRELWAPGTTFSLNFELIVRDGDDEAAQLERLAVALQALASGRLPIGARTSRGFGEGQVAEWHAERYDLTTLKGLRAWVEDAPGDPVPLPRVADGLEDEFAITAHFAVCDSLLVRSEGVKAADPDLLHLLSEEKPVLPGTSVAGALRARARRILSLVPAIPPDRRCALVKDLFGHAPLSGRQRRTGGARRSRLDVSERTLPEGGKELVQHRVSIDRFTGGALETALFAEQPYLPGDDGTIEIRLRLKPAEGRHGQRQIGLLLLLLKDLATGDLPVGGEASVGRGRLRGTAATLCYGSDLWTIDERGRVTSGDGAALQTFVDALWDATVEAGEKGGTHHEPSK